MLRGMKLALLAGLCCVGPMLGADWPDVKYAAVRAYFYNPAGEHDRHIIDRSEKLDSTAVNPDGVVLNAGQVARLLAAINGRHRMHPITACYVPQHAFIFYNSWGRRVAVLELGLECLKASPDPNTAGPYYDFPALAELLHELGLPLGPKLRTPRDYRKKYDRMLRSNS
ncbi:hypothetical protein AYO41_00140 [Verrucomicrobia bacterium SCGC AG-212-E04]|nr:hypothetical protein AYO41_00140 [Verrucomicrobia bacterium SCGC AG-212-E04]